MIPTTVPFNPDQDKLFIRGLDDKSWSTSKGVEMIRKKSAAKFHQMVGFKLLKKKKVLGKMVEYKYQIVPPTGDPWYESLRPEYAEDAIWNRALDIPDHYKDKSYEKYDDVVLEDNFDRKVMRRLATKAFLPSLKKYIKNEDYRDIPEKVKKFKDVVGSHINEIVFIKQEQDKRGGKTQRASLKSYDVVCGTILKTWVENFFNCLGENDVPRQAQVFASLFYLSLYSVLPRHLPDLKKEYYKRIVFCLQPDLSPDDTQCGTLDIISSIIREDKRESQAEMIEMALNRIIKFGFFSEDPGSIFYILPVVHFLRGYKQPATLREAIERNEKAKYWGFNKIPIDVRNTFQKLDETAFSSLLETVLAFSKIDPILKFSFLRCLDFKRFLIVLGKDDLIQLLGLQPLLACSLTWLNKEERVRVDQQKLAETLKGCLDSGLAQRKEKNDVNFIKGL